MMTMMTMMTTTTTTMMMMTTDVLLSWTKMLTIDAMKRKKKH
jgi:hypothetical protein